MANIDKKVDKEDVLAYFEKICGEAPKLMSFHKAATIPACQVSQLAFPNCFAVMMRLFATKLQGSWHLSMSLNLDKVSSLLGPVCYQAARSCAS